MTVKSTVELSGFEFRPRFREFSKAFNKRMTKLMKGAMAAFTRAAIAKIPTKYGTIRSGFLNLSAHLRQSGHPDVVVSIVPERRATESWEKGRGPDALNYKTWSLLSNNGEWIFEISIDVTQVESVNFDYYERHEIVWQSMETGLQAFDNFIDENFDRILDFSIEEFIYARTGSNG